MHRPRFGGVFVDDGCVGLPVHGDARRQVPAGAVPHHRRRLRRRRPRRARYQPGIRMTLSASGAVFSKCRRWRYLLWRRWDEKRPAANFLMLNPRSEEHTSELQSRLHLVCRLLLEKKKKNTIVTTN